MQRMDSSQWLSHRSETSHRDLQTRQRARRIFSAREKFSRRCSQLFDDTIPLTDIFSKGTLRRLFSRSDLGKITWSRIISPKINPTDQISTRMKTDISLQRLNEREWDHLLCNPYREWLWVLVSIWCRHKVSPWRMFRPFSLKPKSSIFNVQSDLTRIFDGFKSRWIIPAERRCLTPHSFW